MSHLFSVTPGSQLFGEMIPPGDKSISHRALMLSAIAEGVTEIEGFLPGEDCLATLKAFQQMGVDIQIHHLTSLRVKGVGLRGLQKPKNALDCGNSGTSIRLLTGLLAGQTFSTELTGDDSLQKRPMARIVEPLRQMGAQIAMRGAGYPPLRVHGSSTLHGITYALPVASAQVKSCLLLAALYASGKTSLIEKAMTRDHTERLLDFLGYPISYDDKQIEITGSQSLCAKSIAIPGDLSSAAFFIVGACIAKTSQLVIKNVGINPTRTGILTILEMMGARFHLDNQRWYGKEPVADITVFSSDLKGIEIPQALVSLAIDEFPIIFIAAACATGQTRLTGASELRVKESDRLQVMAEGLQTLGIDAQTTADGMIIQGGNIKGGCVASQGDHRIAMAFAIAGVRAEEPVIIQECDNVATSFPQFVACAKQLGMHLQQTHE